MHFGISSDSANQKALVRSHGESRDSVFASGLLIVGFSSADLDTKSIRNIPRQRNSLDSRPRLKALNQASARWIQAMPRHTSAAPRYWISVKCSLKINQPKKAAVTTSQVAMMLARLAGRSRSPMVYRA